MMLQRALDAEVPAGWVTADEVYGADRGLCGWLEARQLPYVLAVKRTEPLTLPSIRRCRQPGWSSASRRRAGCASAPARAKGRRWYAWSHLPLDSTGAPTGWQRWLLARRSLHRGAGLVRMRRPGRPAAGRPGPGCRNPLAGRGGVPGRQGTVRPGPAPGPPLALLVPLGDPGHARPRLPGRRRSHRAYPPPTTARADPAHLQRGQPPVRRPGPPTAGPSGPPAALVAV
jgi:hypothetical protein